MTIRSRTYKQFPPGRGQILVPMGSKQEAIAALALAAPCRGRAVTLYRWTHRFVRLFGPALLPGPTTAGPEMAMLDESGWNHLVGLWRDAVGHFDALAWYRRSQSGRPGLLALLLRAGMPLAFVKAEPEANGQGIESEWKINRHLEPFDPTSFSTPRVLEFTRGAGWSALFFTPLPAALHTPPRGAPIEVIVDEISNGLAGLERPQGTPEHWAPAHGDLTPWNLRQYPDGQLWLLDWESARWAPPGSDAVYYYATANALGLEAPRPNSYPEAVDEWLRRTQKPQPSEARDRVLAQGISKALKGLRDSGS